MNRVKRVARFLRPPVVIDEGPEAVALPDEIPVRPPVEKLPDDDDVLTDEDVMSWLKVTKSWLRDHTTRVQPIVPHHPLGHEIRFIRGEIRAMLAATKVTQPSRRRKPPAKAG